MKSTLKRRNPAERLDAAQAEIPVGVVVRAEVLEETRAPLAGVVDKLAEEALGRLVPVLAEASERVALEALGLMQQAGDQAAAGTVEAAAGNTSSLS